jgi:hypothetical protein
MIKKWYVLAILGIGLALTILSFKTEDTFDYNWILSQQNKTPEAVYTVLDETQTIQNDYEIPFTGKSFIAFKQALAFKESQGRYDIVNQFGYAGKYQFGGAALRSVGIKDRREFLSNPALQEKAFEALLAINKHNLQKEIEQYSGMVISGIEITESGILASAHLLGANSVKRFLRNNGKIRITDGYGTTMRSYMKKFAGYDTSVIIANNQATAFDDLVKQYAS